MVRRLIPPLPKWIAVGAGLVALASFGFVETFAPGKTLNWLTTFSATLVSAALAVAGGIWLFHYQTRIRDDREHNRMQTMLAIETRLNLDILQERPGEVPHAGTGEALGQQAVVFVQFPMAALEEVIHGGFEDHGVSLWQMRLAALIRAHNTEVATFLGSRDGTLARAAIRYMTAELSQRQQELRDEFEKLLHILQEAGIQPPS